MKHARFYVSAALLFAIVAAVPLMQWRSAFGQDKGKEAVPAVKWEYKVFHSHGTAKEMEEELNNMGEDGWECVAAVSIIHYVQP